MSSELYYKMINPRSYYEELAESADLFDNILLTSDPHCPPDILDRYSDDMNYKIRYNVASNPNTSKKTLSRMFEIYDRSMKVTIINNINCPLSILELSSFNEYPNMFIGAVGFSPATPENLKMSIMNYLWLSH